MLELQDLSSGDLSMIGRQAGEECGCRLDQIARAADPNDGALRDLLAAMAAETRIQASALSEQQDRRPSGGRSRISLDRIREFIRTAISSLSKGFGEGALHRDNALFYAEILEEEACRFYSMLAEHCREAEARSLFSGLSDRERGKLHYLREVVLQG